jgi:surface polysaccharide O-acyltransferase-like enzyme
MKRLQELDFARVIAMFAVIMIHVSSTYIYFESNYEFLGMNIPFVLNQMSRFCVPMFLLLSGASLGLSSDSGGAKFYRHRLLKIGVPYTCWFFIYLLFNTEIAKDTLGFWGLLRIFLLGGSAPHLYYITIIFQFYLLFPLIKNLVSRHPFASLLLSFGVTYGIQNLFLLQHYGMNLMPEFLRIYLWLMFPTWGFYFILGLVLTREKLSLIQTYCAEHAEILIAITPVFAFFFCLESKASGSTGSIRSSLNLYTVLVFAFAFAVWSRVGSHRVFKKCTLLLAKHSMTIYFSHVLVLYFFRLFPFFTRGTLGMLLLFLSVSVAACVLSVGIDKLAGGLTKISLFKAPMVCYTIYKRFASSFTTRKER